MGELQNKVAIVLGASTPGGMGEAVARRFAREGAKVVVAARKLDDVKQIAQQIGGLGVHADITRHEQIKDLVDVAVSEYGRLDIVVNVVGQAPRVAFREFSEEHLIEMSRLHFVGPAMLIKYVAEAMVPGGAIVNVSSLSAYDPLSGIVGYAASKRAGDRIVQGAAIEYRDKRLRINGLVPSLVLTELSRQGMRNYGADPEAFEKSFVDLTPLGRTATVEDIAACALMLVRDEYFETGQIVFCTGGNALLGQPRFLA
jgi:NAD(P)-dependent dehydrogenase (short-subunit alcohol dehydrogenase family)